MKKIAIVYGTTEGHTAKVAAHIRERATDSGFVCEVYQADQLPDDFDISAYDQALLAASVHEGRYQKSVQSFAKENAAWLTNHRSSLVSVSLAAADMTEVARKDLAAVVQRFAKEAGFSPESCIHVAGALKYTKYNWMKRFIMKQIAKSHDGDIDTSRDFEYTDWNDLNAQVEALVFDPLRS